MRPFKLNHAAYMLLIAIPAVGHAQTVDPPRLKIAPVFRPEVPAENTPEGMAASRRERETVDAILLAGAGVAYWRLNELKASRCRWCDRRADGTDSLTGFDRAIRNAFLGNLFNERSAHKASNWARAGAWSIPPALVVRVWKKPARWSSWADSGQAIAWAVVTDGIVTGTIKRVVARQRPLVHFNNTAAVPSKDENASFPSGHASSSFSSVFASLRTCRIMRCSHEGWIWAAGLPLAGAAATLRISADKHYAIDVLTGAGIGAVLGWFVPSWYTKVRPEKRPLLQPISDKSTIGSQLTWVW